MDWCVGKPRLEFMSGVDCGEKVVNKNRAGVREVLECVPFEGERVGVVRCVTIMKEISHGR